MPEAVETNGSATSERLSATVNKPTPYAYDLAHLCVIDPNPLPPTKDLLKHDLKSRNETLQTYARDGAQTLLNKLLTACPISSSSDSLLMVLPPCDSSNQTPRWKPVPKAKEPTKWETFARKKGIGKYGGNTKGGAALEDRKKNAIFDEEKGEWVKKWGYKGKNKDGQSDWLVELDDKQVKREASLSDGMTIRGEKKRERMERMRRQERKERNNSRRK